MRRLLAVMLIAALAIVPAACGQEPEGALKVIVIGAAPKVRDPSLGPLSAPDAVLLANTAQGLVSFDAGGNIVAGLAERWNVSDDGLSYIFRLQSGTWSDGRKITAEQVARILKREIGPRSSNSLKDRFGAVEDIVAMTDRVIEISLVSPRPDLLALLAQPEMAILRNGAGSGPFRAASKGDETRLEREIESSDDEAATRQQLLLGAAPAPDAVRAFAIGQADLLLGGTYLDLPYARRVKLPRDALRFDPASGLFGLLPASAGGPFDKPQARQLLSQALDRDAYVAALGVPGLAGRATLLEPGLDGLPPPVTPAWLATAFGDRLPALQAQAARLFGNDRRAIRVALPDGPGSDLILQLLRRSWGALGFTVERVNRAAGADFVLIDEVAPSSSPSWFVRRLRCAVVPVCDSQADALMDAARQSPVPAQRYALLGQAAARIDDAQLFIPITAPVRWSLVSARIQNFAGNRYARHTLTDLEVRPSNGD